MIKEETTPLVLHIAGEFVTLVRKIEPKWDQAYFRFRYQDSASEAKGSYASGAEITIINTLQHKDFFHPIAEKGKELLSLLGKSQGVFLLRVNSKLEYEITFEYEDMDRWKISKMEGGTGIPEGI